jgi:hypothetical protein
MPQTLKITPDPLLAAAQGHRDATECDVGDRTLPPPPQKIGLYPQSKLKRPRPRSALARSARLSNFLDDAIAACSF